MTEATETTPETPKAAPSEKLKAWISTQRESAREQWTSALDRARTHLDPQAEETPAEPQATLGTRILQAVRGEILETPIVIRAQERGAELLLGTMRRIRAQLETLERNLEAAAPPLVA